MSDLGEQPPPVGPEQGSGAVDARPIDRAYYESSGYFEGGGSHLTDPDSRFHQYRIREVLRRCGPLEGQRAVDLGCGWGTISFALAEWAAEVVGVDFAEASIEICRARHDPEVHPGLRFLRGDARATGLEARAWDLVVAADLVEHLYPDDTLAVFREAARLLRPGGHFVVWTPSPTHFLEVLRRWGVLRRDPTHVDYETLDRVVEEVEATGFEVVRAEHVPSHLPGLRWLERLGQEHMPWLRRRVAVVATIEMEGGTG